MVPRRPSPWAPFFSAQARTAVRFTCRAPDIRSLCLTHIPLLFLLPGRHNSDESAFCRPLYLSRLSIYRADFTAMPVIPASHACCEHMFIVKVELYRQNHILRVCRLVSLDQTQYGHCREDCSKLTVEIKGIASIDIVKINFTSLSDIVKSIIHKKQDGACTERLHGDDEERAHLLLQYRYRAILYLGKFSLDSQETHS